MILKIAEKNKDFQTAETTANKIIELEEFAKWRIKQIPDTTPEEHLKSEMKQYNITMYRRIKKGQPIIKTKSISEQIEEQIKRIKSELITKQKL